MSSPIPVGFAPPMPDRPDETPPPAEEPRDPGLTTEPGRWPLLPRDFGYDTSERYR